MSDIVVISEGERLADDLIVVARDTRIAGTVTGDVLVFTDKLTVTGSIEGDILGFARRADISGEVLGSVRLTGGTVEIPGSVSEDVTTAVVTLSVAGTVSRDIYALGGSLQISGRVGRDVAGRVTRRTVLSGQVGRDLEPVTPVLVVTDSASVAGTIVVWPRTDASISEAADVGSVAQRSAAGSQLQVRAGLLLIRLVVSILFVLAGIGLFWLFPNSLARADRRVRAKLLPTALWGLLALAIPLLLAIITTVVAALAPVFVAAPALVVLVPLTLLVGALAAVAVLVAPIPVLAAAGQKAFRGRVSPVAGFVAAAVVWLIVIALPYVGGVVGAAVAVIGVGAWISGAWGARGDPAWAFETEESGPSSEIESPLDSEAG
ncbi:MAG: hypothetical protein ACE5MI_04465 [Acidimicrobiia bacterium]